MMQTQPSAYHLKLKNCRQLPEASVSVSPVKTHATTVTTTAQSTPIAVPTSTYSTTSLASNSSRIACSDTASDIVDADYVDRNIPKMELLKINYVSKSRNSLTTIDDPDLVQLRAKKRVHPKQLIRSHSDGLLKVNESAKLDAPTIPTQPTKRQAPARPLPATPTTHATPAQPVHHQHPLKYAVYKKHNSVDVSALAKQEKLQYTNDEAFFKSRKKYLVFDGRKRNGLDNIQFYFDSKSYEQHVDNKMYGIVMNSPAADERRLSNGSGDSPRTSAIINDTRHSASESKSNSWNFVKATRTLLHNAAMGKSGSSGKTTRNVPSAGNATRKAVSHGSMTPSVDVTRIGELFKEARRASADDVLDTVQQTPLPALPLPAKPTETSASKSVKKLADDFENKCICDNTERKTSLPTHLHAITNTSTTAATVAANNKSNESNIKFRRRLEFPVPSATELPSKTSNVRRFEKSISATAAATGFKLSSDGRSRSVINIDHGKPLFGHFQSNGNASTNSNGSRGSSSSSTCGYKNCTFVNCPMSSVTAALSNVNNAIEKKCTKSPPIESDDGGSSSNGSSGSAGGRKKSPTHKISMTKIDTISNKSKLYLKTKDFNEDDDDEQLLGDSLALNNLKNLKNSTIFSINDINGAGNDGGAGGHSNCTGGTTIPIKFTPSTQNLNNSMKSKSIEKLDFNSSSTFEDQKLNNLQTTAVGCDAMATSQRDDQNRVKIFIRNAPPAVSVSSRQSTASSSEESTSDYYDSVPAEDDYVTSSANSAKRLEDCSSPESGVTEEDLLTTLADAKATAPLSKSTSNLKNLFPNRLGCDGAIFWNDCYFYDEHACCGCKGTEIITDRNATVVRSKEAGEACSCHSADDIDSFSDDTKQVENSNSRIFASQVFKRLTDRLNYLYIHSE